MSILGELGRVLGGVILGATLCAAWHGGGDGQRQAEATKKALKQAGITAINELAVVPAELNELAMLESVYPAVMDRRQRLFPQLSEGLQGQAGGGAGWGPKAAALRAALDDIESRIEAFAAKGSAYGDAGGRLGARQQVLGALLQGLGAVSEGA